MRPQKFIPPPGAQQAHADGTGKAASTATPSSASSKAVVASPGLVSSSSFTIGQSSKAPALTLRTVSDRPPLAPSAAPRLHGRPSPVTASRTSVTSSATMAEKLSKAENSPPPTRSSVDGGVATSKKLAGAGTMSLGNILLHRDSSGKMGSMGDTSDEDASSTGTGARGVPASPLGVFRRKTAHEEASLFSLSRDEIAYLSMEVRRRLGRKGGQLPPTPAVFQSKGAVLFVDVSGFTKLGEDLRATLGPVPGSAFLAGLITRVITELTLCVQDHGGDVAKFAGDALLCLWEGGPEDAMLARAKDCALAMLRAMRKLNKTSGTSLDIHGGLASGSILHFHLGSADDELRWYLVAGEAHTNATSLVDEAAPGEILCLASSASTPTNADNGPRTGRTMTAASISIASIAEDSPTKSGPDPSVVSSYKGAPSVTSPTSQSARLFASGGRATDLSTPGQASRTPRQISSNLPGGAATGTVFRRGSGMIIGELDPSYVMNTATAPLGTGEQIRASMMGIRGEARRARAGSSIHSSAIQEHAVAADGGLLPQMYVTGPIGKRASLALSVSQSEVSRASSPQATRASALTLLLSPPRLSSLKSTNRLESFVTKITLGDNITFADQSANDHVSVASSKRESKDPAGSMDPWNPQNDPGTLVEDEDDGALLDDVAMDELEEARGRAESAMFASRRYRVETEEDPTLRSGLPRFCNVYMPKSLRQFVGNVSPEMRHGVAIIFVDIEDLVLTDAEIDRHRVADEKLDNLNQAFVRMVRAAHAFGGEVRDFLFDDKGCVFIAAFGAHPNKPETQAPATDKRGKATFVNTPQIRGMQEAIAASNEFRATKAAMAINLLVPGSRVGVASGSCFVGMCGIAKRRDFIIIGHDVNVAARLMVQAQRDQVLVSPEVRAVSGQVLRFAEQRVSLRKKANNETTVVYSPVMEAVRKDPVFLSEFRYAMQDKDCFVGRRVELTLVEDTIRRMCLDSHGKSGVVLVEAEQGMGKASLVTRIRKMGKGRINIASGRARPGDEVDADYGVYRDLLQSLTGLRPVMRPAEIKDCLKDFTKKGPSVDLQALSKILPYVAVGSTYTSSILGVASSTLQLKRKVFESSGTSSSSAMMALTPSRKGTAPTPQAQSSPHGVFDQEDPFNDALRKEVAVIGKAVVALLACTATSAAARSVGGIKGCLLVIENVNHLDSRSLVLLEYIVDHFDSVKRMALLMTVKFPIEPNVATLGQGDNARVAQVRILMEKIKRSTNNVCFALTGLGRADADSLVARVFGRPPDVALGKSLYEASGGHPMSITLLSQFVRDKGLVVRVPEAECFSWAPGGEKKFAARDVTQGHSAVLVQAVRARFDTVAEPDTKSVLVKTAASGATEFDTIFVCVATGLTESRVLSGLRSARELGFIIHVDEDHTKPEKEHAWCFKHDVVREGLRTLVSEAERTELERKLDSERRATLLRVKLGFHGTVEDFDMV